MSVERQRTASLLFYAHAHIRNPRYRAILTSTAWYGMEISVRNMEDARMEWNRRFQEWNGRQSFILPYQFYTRFRSWHLPKIHTDIE